MMKTDADRDGRFSEQSWHSVHAVVGLSRSFQSNRAQHADANSSRRCNVSLRRAREEAVRNAHRSPHSNVTVKQMKKASKQGQPSPEGLGCHISK